MYSQSKFQKKVNFFDYIVKGKDLFSKIIPIYLIQKIYRILILDLHRIFPDLLYRYKLKNNHYDIEIA